jgi:hypothetical protein
MLSGWNNNNVIWVEQYLCYLGGTITILSGGTITMLSGWNNNNVTWVEQ